PQLNREKVYTRHVAAGPVETGDEAVFHRIATDREENGDRRRHGLSGDRRSDAATCYDYGDLTAHQVRRQCRQLIVLIVGPAVFDGHVLTFAIADLAQPPTKCGHEVRVRVWRAAAQKSDHRHPRLLRARRERPRDRSAAEQRDEIAARHSITSSAMASS